MKRNQILAILNSNRDIDKRNMRLTIGLSKIIGVHDTCMLRKSVESYIKADKFFNYQCEEDFFRMYDAYSIISWYRPFFKGLHLL